MTIGSELVKLRGRLKAEELGARGIEKAARNVDCLRARALAGLGITPATAVESIYREPANEQLSPFALAASKKFEYTLFANNAERLIDLYREKGRLGAAETSVINIEQRLPGETQEVMRQRVALTRELLARKLRRETGLPNIIIKPRLIIKVLEHDYQIEPDVLVASASDSCYRIVEIKSYVARGGKTSDADLRNARRQSAVGVMALRQLMARLGSDGDGVPPVADIILRRPYSYYPALSIEMIAGEITSVESFMARLARDITATAELLQSQSFNAIDSAAALSAVPYNYLPDCREYCALAKICKQQAIAEGALVLLGRQARDGFAPAGSLARAYQLMMGAAAQSPEEAELRAELVEALRLYEEALAHVA